MKPKEIEQIKKELYDLGVLSYGFEFCSYSDNIATFQFLNCEIMCEISIISDQTYVTGMTAAEILNYQNIQFCDLGVYSITTNKIKSIVYSPIINQN